MRIKMLRTEAGPSGVRLANRDYDVSDKEGSELVEGGYAESLDASPAKKPAGKGAKKEKDDPPTGEQQTGNTPPTDPPTT